MFEKFLPKKGKEKEQLSKISSKNKDIFSEEELEKSDEAEEMQASKDKLFKLRFNSEDLKKTRGEFEDYLEKEGIAKRHIDWAQKKIDEYLTKRAASGAYMVSAGALVSIVFGSSASWTGAGISSGLITFGILKALSACEAAKKRNAGNIDAAL